MDHPLISEKRRLCQERPAAIAFPESREPRILQAAHRMLTEASVSQIALFGLPDEILKAAKGQSLDFRAFGDQVQFIGEDAALKERISSVLRAQYQAKARVLDEQTLSMWQGNPLAQAAVLLCESRVKAVVSGAVATTADVIRAGLTFVGLREGNRTVSGSFFLAHPQRTQLREVLFADSAVIIEPSEDQIVDIAQESVDTWVGAKMGAEPAVAFLSFSTRGSAVHPSSEKMARAASRFKERCPGVLCEGEIQFDAAIDAAIGGRKCPGSSLPGRANIFIFPNLDAGNIAYKIMQRIGGYTAIGPLLQGLKLPYSDLSRGSTVDDIVASAYFNLLRGAAS